MSDGAEYHKVSAVGSICRGGAGANGAKGLGCGSLTLFKIGSPGRTRTSDQAVNSRSLYQLSYRGSEPRWRAPPLEAGSGIEPLYEDLQSSA